MVKMVGWMNASQAGTKGQLFYILLHRQAVGDAAR